MKKLLSIGLVALFVAGCSISARRTTYNTLYSVHATTDAAFTGYIELVVKGSVPTNDVPKIAQSYQAFQGAFNVALALAQYQTNAPATEDVLNLSTVVINQIATAKEAK